MLFSFPPLLLLPVPIRLHLVRLNHPPAPCPPIHLVHPHRSRHPPCPSLIRIARSRRPFAHLYRSRPTASDDVSGLLRSHSQHDLYVRSRYVPVVRWSHVRVPNMSKVDIKTNYYLLKFDWEPLICEVRCFFGSAGQGKLQKSYKLPQTSKSSYKLP